MPTRNTDAAEDYLDSKAVMARVRISRRTLDRYVKSGKLPVSVLPSGHRRYAPADVDALLTSSRPETEAAS